MRQAPSRQATSHQSGQASTSGASSDRGMRVAGRGGSKRWRVDLQGGTVTTWLTCLHTGRVGGLALQVLLAATGVLI